MYAALKNHPANITVTVDGVAASAASFIAQAGNTRVMEPNARMMIHDASGGAYGNPAAILKMAALLEDASDNIASIYAERTGMTPEEHRKAMKIETWYSAQAAVDIGLADSIAESPKNSINTSEINNGTIINNKESDTGWDFDIISLVKETLRND
jgi:ATP-dependent protease ClpP protease subunit